MPDKEFTVVNPKTRQTFTITGKSLKNALEKEGLDPAIWVEVKPEPESEDEPHGNAD